MAATPTSDTSTSGGTGPGPAFGEGFFATASHDLRQPLQSLLLLVDILKHSGPTGPLATAVERLEQAAGILETLVTGVIDYARLTAGEVPCTIETVAVNDIFQRLNRHWAPRSEQHGLGLTLVETGLEVRSDAALLETVLDVFIANALSQTTDGAILIGARPRGDRVHIQVWDTGPGIPPAHQDRVFEEFHKVPLDNGMSSPAPGLGLAKARQIARLLDHEVGMTSRPGRGSVFWISALRAAGDQPKP